jgi:hypothetical protein
MSIDSKRNVFATVEFLAGREADGRSMHAKRAGGGLALFSYGEPIAFREVGGRLLVEREWKYSRTTERHRKLLAKLLADASFAAEEVTREEIRGFAGLDPTAPPPPLVRTGRT